MKKWKKTSLGLLSIVISSSMIVFTPVEATEGILNNDDSVVQVYEVNNIALNTLIQEVESLNAETYSIKSWKNLMVELNEAKVVRETATSQAELDEAYEDLLELKNLLVDRSPLKAKLEEAALKLAQTDQYTAESLNALRRVYNVGLEAYNNAFSD